MMSKQLPIVLLLATSTAACVAASDDGEPSESDVASAIEMENGGLTDTDEAPAFNEPSAFDADVIEPDRQIEDPMNADPRVDAIEGAPTAVRHRVFVAWGRMPLDLTATSGRNWSGSLTTSRGALLVGRAIGFEDQTDQILPRQTPDRVDFRSVTRPHADGLILHLIDPDPSAGSLSLTYASADAATTLTLDLAQLATGPLVIDAGDGNRVIAVALPDRDACDHGFLRGRWVKLREGLGAYRGIVTDEAGQPTGHIRGIWGTRRTGEPVMFGKFIAPDGSFRGLLVGTYENGTWRSRWMTRAGEHGVAGGFYVDAPNLPGGVFGGRYAEAGCAQ